MSFFSGATALLAAGRRPHVALLVEHDFNDATYYNWTGIGDIVIGGHTYVGKGELGKIGALPFGDDDAAQVLNCTLSGVKAEWVVEARTMPTVRGRGQRIYLQFFDADTLQPVDPPYLLADRLMDVMGYHGVGATERTITLSSEDIWSGRDTAEHATYSHSDQQALFPGDLGLEFVAEMVPGSRVEWPDFSNE